MVSKAKKTSKKSFNWSGITDNYDGSFTADDKRARKRLTREFHNQGFKSRSERLPDGRYRISPVGVKAFKTRMEPDPTLSAPSFGDEGSRAGRNPRMYSGARPRTRYTRPRGYQYVRPVISGGYRPNYYGSPRVGPRLGSAIIQGARRYSAEKTRRIKEQEEHDIWTRKNKAAMSRKFAVAELNEQRAKRAMMVHRKPELATALQDAEQRTEARRTGQIIQRQQEQRDIRQKARLDQGGWVGTGPLNAPKIPVPEAVTIQRQQDQRIIRQQARISQGGGGREAPTIPKQPEPKRSSDAEVQKARQEYVSGGL